MFRSTLVVATVLGLTFQLAAVERGKIGISVETMTFMDLYTSSFYESSTGNSFVLSSPPPLASVGLRFSPSTLVDIDVSYGFSMATEVKADSATNTTAVPSYTSHSFSAGVVVNPFAGERAILGLYGRLSGYQTKMIIDEGPYDGASVYLAYNSFAPRFSVGVEPSYYFSKNFSIFFRTGVGMTMIPAAKYAVLKQNGDPTQASGYELKDAKNSRVALSTDGVALGLRFLFVD